MRESHWRTVGHREEEEDGEKDREDIFVLFTLF